MPTITLPNDLQDGVDTAFGSEVLANDKAIADVVNGQLASDNLASNANIKGSQLSGVSGERVGASKIEDDAIDASKLRDDVDLGDANRAVTANHIRNGVIEKKKMTTVGGLKLTVAQLEISTGSGAITVAPTGTAATWGITGGGPLSGSAAMVAPVNVAGFWQFQITGVSVSASGSANLRGYSGTVDPNAIGIGSLSVASKLILGCYIQNPAFGASLTGTLYVVYISMT